MKKALPYIVAIAICFVLGFIAGRLQQGAIENWYPYLDKPSLTPPNWAFPLAWGIIYLLSGISFGLVWNSQDGRRSGLVTLWGVQQFFNFTWSLTFFVMQNPFIGFINIIVLDLLVLWYIIRTWPVNRTAARLFLPYMAWIAFATYLNGYIMIHNG